MDLILKSLDGLHFLIKKHNSVKDDYVLATAGNHPNMLLFSSVSPGDLAGTYITAKKSTIRSFSDADHQKIIDMVVNFMAMAHILLSMLATLLVTATPSQIQMERSLCTSAEFWLGTPLLDNLH